LHTIFLKVSNVTKIIIFDMPFCFTPVFWDVVFPKTAEGQGSWITSHVFKKLATDVREQREVLQIS
jgi:hypothetical protein